MTQAPAFQSGLSEVADALPERDQVLDSLDLALSHLGKSSGDFDLPDPLAFADVVHTWPQRRLALADRILAGDTGPASVELVDFPKSELMVRPLARMATDSRLIYEASVLGAVDHLNGALSRSVYSSRWWPKERRLLAPTSRWMKMQEAALSFHLRNRTMMMARADISSFYENVNLGTLFDDLASFDLPLWSRSGLANFLEGFNALNNVWGLPQGYDVTGILANTYLLPVDQFLARQGIRFFRYSDDFLIFGNDWASLRQVLLQITYILRGRHLVLAPSKTKIVESRDIPAELEDMRKVAINYGIINFMPETGGKLYEVFDRSVSSVSVNVRDFKYSLSKLAEIGDSYAVDWILENLGRIPHACLAALRYLGNFHRNDSAFVERVVDLLQDDKLAFYPQARQHVLIYMILHSVRGEMAASAVAKVLADRSEAPFVREFASRYLGLHAKEYATDIMQHFQEEYHPTLKRALLVACYEAGKSSDKWLSAVAKGSPGLRDTAEYLLSKPSSIPYPIVERPSND